MKKTFQTLCFLLMSLSATLNAEAGIIFHITEETGGVDWVIWPDPFSLETYSDRSAAEAEFKRLSSRSSKHYKLFMTTHRDSDGAILSKVLISDSISRTDAAVSSSSSVIHASSQAEHVKLFERYLTMTPQERKSATSEMWSALIDGAYSKEEFRKLLTDATYSIDGFVAGFAIDNIFKILACDASERDKLDMFSAQMVGLMNMTPHAK